MTTNVKAVYEKGALRPLEKLPLIEGQHIELIVKTTDGATGSTESRPKRTPAEILAEIAAMPLQSPRDGFSGADHDAVLYRKTKR